MKIIQIMPEFRLAGAEIMCENLTYELIKKGHEVMVVSLFNKKTAITKRLEKNRVNLIYLDKKPGLDISIIKKIRKVLKQYKPDVIHTHLYILKYVAVAAIGLRIKGIIHTVHNIAQKENGFVDRKINKLLFYKNNIIPVALSKNIQKTINEEYHIPINKIPIVFNGVPLPESEILRDYSNKNVIRIINVGRYSDVKNQITLISAIVDLHKEDPRIVLDLFGDGELKQDINNAIYESGASEYIKDNGLTDKVHQKLVESDIFVLPSKYEGIPMTIIEAMGMSLPIVASNVGGVPDMIDDEIDGLLCDYDKESIKDAIRKIINSQSLRERLGKAAYCKAKVFSSDKMAGDYLNIYNNCTVSKNSKKKYQE